MAVRTKILQRRHTEHGEPNHSLTGQGHGRGEEAGLTVVVGYRPSEISEGLRALSRVEMNALRARP
jgi:hypothetical protein